MRGNFQPVLSALALMLWGFATQIIGDPEARAAAYFARPSALSICAASLAFFMFPSSTRTAGYCAKFRPARSARPYSPCAPT
jgi:hypothetical protein